MNSIDLVTGGAGLLGLALGRKLAESGRRVRLFDIREPESPPPGAEVVTGDIRDPADVDRAVAGAERVFHLATLMHVGKIRPKMVRDVNIGGLKNVMRAAERHGVGRIVFSSTIELYGTAPADPCTEDSPKDPPPGYPAHKWESENLLLEFSGRTGIPVGFTRMPMILGPGFYHFKMILSFFDALRAGLSIPLLDGGRKKGRMVALDDAVQGLMLVGEREEAIGEAFNICCAEVWTHRGLIEEVIERVGSRSRVVSVPSSLIIPGFKLASALGLSPVAPEHFYFALNDCNYVIDKAVELLGYKPTKTSAEAMAETHEHYLDNRRKLKKKKVKIKR
ncbi:MAG: NAD-dependent epimerase/dehydratase family protein [bacterium]